VLREDLSVSLVWQGHARIRSRPDEVYQWPSGPGATRVDDAEHAQENCKTFPRTLVILILNPSSVLRIFLTMEFGRITPEELINNGAKLISINCVVIILMMAFSLSAINSHAQDSTIVQQPTVGIYITLKFNKKCENQVVNFDNKKFCLAAQPVLTVDDISHISAIKIDLANQSYFSLVFTEDGVKKLKNLSIAFPNTQIVLVVDKLIVGFLTDLDSLRSNSLKMTAGSGSTQNVEFVHDKMKAVLPVKNQ
jgi:hypothetical protein